MAEIIGAVTGILSCLCSQKCLNESIGRKCGHLRRPKRLLDKLRRKMEELKALAMDVEKKLEKMQVQHEIQTTERVQLWQKRVEKIESEVRSLTNVDRQVGLDRCYPNYFCSRIKLGEVIEKKIEEVIELIEEKGQISDDSLAERLLRRGYTLPTTQLMGNTTTMDEILRYLKDDEVGRIGVYGMGGVGKTTIMTEIYNRLLEESSCFESVIWITVPKESNLEKLQDAIAKEVNLDLSGCEELMRRRAELNNALKKRKSFVLILDDLWEAFLLEDVGIPVLENGCKLVITTRKLGICRHMQTDREVEVKALSEDEAWDLFYNKVGEQVLRSPGIKRYSRDVVKELGGLPLAIITVRLALRTTDISEWETALTELRSSTANIENMEELVFAKLRFSYTKLRDDTSRSCFLCCALYPEDHQINANELIEYWMWEGLLGDVGSIEAKKQKGKIILNELKNTCLLERVTKHRIEYVNTYDSIRERRIEYVRMHDLIRDMAIKITSERSRCIIKAGIGLRNAPGSDEWTEDVQRVSLMINHVETIPFSPKCPKLTSLLLQYNSFSQNIPHSFFDYMPSLTVLNLSHTRIQFLPSSLSNLENLCTLFLSNCWKLKTLPSLTKLVKLRVLDLKHCSTVQEIPHGMEQLGNLRHLNLSWTNIDMFPVGLLAVFTLLEEFLMEGVKLSCGSSSLKLTRGGVDIEEVIGCRYLSMLEVQFSNLEVFDSYVRSGHWAQLQIYNFNTPGQSPRFLENRFLSSPVLENRSVTIRGSFLLRGSPVLLPSNSSQLNLYHCCDIIRFSMCLSNLMQLKVCEIESCPKMQSIVKSGENKLSTLERMQLFYLTNLTMICEGVVEPLTLSSLKIIVVNGCDQLKCLFLGGLLQQLQNLEEIDVRRCRHMEDIMLDDRGTVQVVLPLLTSPDYKS